MFNEQSRMELGQLHMSGNAEVFGEKNSHLREYNCVIPRYGRIKLKYNTKLEYNSGVQIHLYQTTHKASFNWTKLVAGMKIWKLMKMMKLKNSDWHDDRHRRRTIHGYITCLCENGPIVRKFYLQTMVMSSSGEKKRAISSAVMFVLQVLRKMNKPAAIPTEVLMDGKGLIYMSEGTSRSIRTGHVEARLRMLQEQVADLVVEIKCVKTDGNIVDSTVRVEVFEGHSKDSVRDKQECEAPTHPTETELREMNSEVQHWSSVGRVSEIHEDTGTDARAVSYPILSVYSVDWVYLLEHVKSNFEVNLITKTGGPVNRSSFTCEPLY